VRSHCSQYPTSCHLLRDNGFVKGMCPPWPVSDVQSLSRLAPNVRPADLICVQFPPCAYAGEPPSHKLKIGGLGTKYLGFGFGFGFRNKIPWV